MAEAPDEDVDRLYGLPLEEFIPARDALAKELRDSGRRGEATAIKALKKPTVAAWAANQAVRSQPRAARDLWEAGDALAAAQEAVLSGKGSGGDLRSAAERERLALDPLVDAARGLLTTSGGDLSETTIDRVRATLQAAAIDADAREEVAAGRAVREREPRGLFGGEAAVAAPGGGSGGSGRGRSARDSDRSAGTGTEEKPARGRSAAPDRGRSAADRSGGSSGTEDKPARGRSSTRARSAADRDRSAADAAREREEAAAARKREREEKAARERARKAAAARVARAENALAAAEARSAKTAEALEDARAREREAVEALADARAELRAAER
jgi:hypothetical protein